MAEFVPVKIHEALGMLAGAADQKGSRKRNLRMPGIEDYQPKELKEYLGYDQFAGFCVIVEWFWLQTLAHFGFMPKAVAELLTPELLKKLIDGVVSTLVRRVEREDTRFGKKTNHDIIALLKIMRSLMPEELRPWLHLGCTSYDIICTTYGLQARRTLTDIFYPRAQEVDKLWRKKIGAYMSVVQCGRTHLQVANPITPGFWLSTVHDRFRNTVHKALDSSKELTGKFAGPVGTYALLTQLCRGRSVDPHMLEHHALQSLGLPAATVSTQIVQPEFLARFYGDLVFVSGALAQLGEDARHLQATEIGEITSASSTSSAMSHKTGNPIAAENDAGMRWSVQGEYFKVLATLDSDLQRDLRGSNVMRGFSSIFVFCYQQLATVERLLKSMEVDVGRCKENFDKHARLTTAELLHTLLQLGGVADAHAFVNAKIIPAAKSSGENLTATMDKHVKRLKSSSPVKKAWAAVKLEDRLTIADPSRYLGDAVGIARKQAVERALF